MSPVDLSFSHLAGRTICVRPFEGYSNTIRETNIPGKKNQTKHPDISAFYVSWF